MQHYLTALGVTKSNRLCVLGLAGRQRPELRPGVAELAHRCIPELWPSASRGAGVAVEGLLCPDGAERRAHVALSHGLTHCFDPSDMSECIAAWGQQVRFIVVYWSNDLFGFDHVPSRLIDLMAVGDSQHEIAEEAQLGLRPDHHVVSGGLKTSNRLDKAELPSHPPFRQVIAAIVDAAPELLLESTAERSLPFAPAVCEAMLAFMQACVTDELKVGPRTRPEFFRQLEEEAPECLDGYLALIGSMFVDQTEPKLQRAVAAAVGNISSGLAGGGSSRVTAFSRADRLVWLRRWLLRTGNELTQETVAASLGDVATGMPAADVSKLVASLCTIAANPREGVGERYGSLVAVGTLAGQKQPDEQLLLDDASRVTVCKLLCETAAVEKHEALRRACCLAIALVGRACALPLELDVVEEPPAETNGAEDPPTVPCTRLRLVASVIAIMEAPTAKGKLAELAAAALGAMCLGDRQLEVVDAVLDALLCTPDKLQSATGDAGNQAHFVVGKALVLCASGADTKHDEGESTAMQVEPAEPEGEAGAPKPAAAADQVEKLINTVFGRCAVPDKPRHRAAGCIWLLCLVQKLPHHACVYPRLLEAQQVFMGMLGDRSEIIQDVASRGVAVVYENSDQATKSSLVKALVGGLASDRTTAKTIDSTADNTSDSSVLGAGGLGKAPAGHGTSTYKELCSLVNDMGQPDLIYKFMGLASQGAMLNTKAGMSIGLGSIAVKAQAELAQYLPELVPKLYRYQHDPTPKIQQSMRGMWQTLVPDPKATVEEYFDAIMAELLDGIGQRQWRVRESSSLALAELISGKPPEKIREHLGRIWKMVLRAMDDIKETVRVAADRVGRVIANMSVKMCDSGIASPTDGPAACAIVIPYLLQQGLTATAGEVRAFAMKNLIKISKSAGPWLRPHIPEIAPAMLENLSLMEPAMFNYAQFHVADKELLETLRTTAAQTGPCSEVIDLCVRYADESAVSALAPHLSGLLRTAVGLPSRAGVGRFINQLCVEHKVSMKNYAGKMCKTLVAVLRVEPIVPLQRVFAGTLANCCRLATRPAVATVVAGLLEHYRESSQVAGRRTVAAAFRELTANASDAMQPFASDTMPIGFIGKTDADKELASLWNQVWDSGAQAGDAAAIKKHVDPIIKLAVGCLNSPIYALRAQGSAAIAVVALTPRLVLPPGLLAEACTGLCTSLPGRLWEGKVAVLAAVAALCKQLAEPGSGEAAAAAAAATAELGSPEPGQKRPREPVRVAAHSPPPQHCPCHRAVRLIQRSRCAGRRGHIAE